MPYLYESTTGDVSKYVALSYCWGNSGNLRTLSNNIESHKQGIDRSKIPRTIQDATRLTRRLGVRYLWVDALCIVQNDPDDWTTEAARMANVYEGAHLVIAATSSPDVNQGFLHWDRPHLRCTKPMCETLRGRRSLSTEWLVMLMDYAGRSLKHLDDKLAALQGVAARFEHPDLGRYCYGFWETTNIDGLAWYAEHPSENLLSSYAVLQLGPSWSWVSTYDSIVWIWAEAPSYGLELSEPPARIWDIASMQPMVDPRRAILYPPPPGASWLLQLVGKVATGTVRHQRPSDYGSKIHFGQLPLATTDEVLTPDGSALIQRTKAFNFFPDVNLSGEGAAATAALTLAKHVQDGQLVTCVFLKRAGVRGGSVWVAMVLKPAQDRLGVYMRVGIAVGHASRIPELVDDPWDDAPIRIIDIE
ncbi:hypothetical protein LTS10_002649 [Elasticomyces elasticus]|nr:hypothetical protein LTS10_002649 [Elasticomyces elasticus]